MNKANPIRLPDDGNNEPTLGVTETVEISARSNRSSNWRVTSLRLRVHADAFRYDPLGYLQAVGWRMRGLRLRSRNRIAALAGRSPHAYRLWIERDEPRAMAAQPRLATLEASKILIVIDCQGGTKGVKDTLASIPAAFASDSIVVVGGPAMDATASVEHPADLSKFIVPSSRWLCLLMAGDLLAEGAMEIYAAAAANAGDSRVVYSDDDLIEDSSLRQAPLFKPDWNPDLFENHDFISGSAIVKVDVTDVPTLPNYGWIQTLIARATDAGGQPVHLPVVLHHRKARPRPIVPSRPTRRIVADPPRLTAIIPTRNHGHLLRTCIEGLRRAAYPDIETIVIDNGSDEPNTLCYLRQLEADGTKVLVKPGPFNFSALNNAAVEFSHGEMLCFLNNDVEMLDEDWLSLLVRQAMRPDIGAVGARLLYPDGTVQHAGVCTGIGGGAGHAHRFLGANETGYFERARLPQRVSAVTGACLVVTKKKFLAVGGFDDQEFPVAFNDVDLCLKLNARGWQSFYEPRATLIHHESKSRGSDAAKNNRARFAGELAALKRKWGTDTRRDPFHHPNLSPFCEQFLIAV